MLTPKEFALQGHVYGADVCIEHAFAKHVGPDVKPHLHTHHPQALHFMLHILR